jgi:hypothetical protein
MRVPLATRTHIETAADFHHAIVAGVDEIAHMPGFPATPPSGYRTLPSSRSPPRTPAWRLASAPSWSNLRVN